jgi:hypothetical protein
MELCSAFRSDFRAIRSATRAGGLENPFESSGCEAFQIPDATTMALGATMV